MNEQLLPNGAKGKRSVRNFLLMPLIQIKLGLYSFLTSCFFASTIMFILWQNLGVFGDLLGMNEKDTGEAGMIYQNYVMFAQIFISATVLFFILLNLIIGIVYTHRLIGPTVAFSNHVDRLLAGQFSERIKLRKTDSFTELADKLNLLTDILEKNNGKINPLP